MVILNDLANKHQNDKLPSFFLFWAIVGKRLHKMFASTMVKEVFAVCCYSRVGRQDTLEDKLDERAEDAEYHEGRAEHEAPLEAPHLPDMSRQERVEIHVQQLCPAWVTGWFAGA